EPSTRLRLRTGSSSTSRPGGRGTWTATGSGATARSPPSARSLCRAPPAGEGSSRSRTPAPRCPAPLAPAARPDPGTPPSRQPPFEEVAFGPAVRQRERALVRDPRFCGAPEPTQQVGARRVEVAVVVERKLIDKLERGFGPLDLGERDGTVHLHDRRFRQGREGSVEGGDLLPVSGILEMKIGDGGLDHVRPPPPRGRCG